MRQLPEAMRDALLCKAPLRTFEDGQIIQQSGEDAAGFWVIEQGSVRVGRFLAKGTFRAVAALSNGDSYGELAVLAGNQRAVDAVAAGRVQLRWVDGNSYRKAVMGDSAALGALVTALAMQLQEVLGLVTGLGAHTSRARVAALLSTLSGGTPGLLKVGQEELGDLLGLTRATVNASLKALEQEGMIRRGYRRIEVVDPVGLAQSESD